MKTPTCALRKLVWALEITKVLVQAQRQRERERERERELHKDRVLITTSIREKRARLQTAAAAAAVIKDDRESLKGGRQGYPPTGAEVIEVN